MDFQKYFFKVQIWLLYSWIILRVCEINMSLCFLRNTLDSFFFYPHSKSNLDLSEVAFHTITRISLKLLWKGTYIILISGMKWLSSTSWSLFTQFFFNTSNMHLMIVKFIRNLHFYFLFAKNKTSCPVYFSSTFICALVL